MDKNSIGVILIYVAFMAVLILPTYFSNKKKKQQKAALLENLKGSGDLIKELEKLKKEYLKNIVN